METQENTKHFILHLHKGLADKLLGSFTLKERDKEIKKLESTHDEVYHYFIPISVQGKIKKLNVDGHCWNEEIEKDYFTLPCSKCLKDFKKNAIDFLLGPTEKENTICPECIDNEI